jgi:hypothetical protein
MTVSRRTLSKSSDYLDALATTLRDLGGATTIPRELTQNADDAGNASLIRFTVNDDALVVWNDGTFTDCGEDAESCRREKRCDLHAFRRFAGRTKASDSTTTGAFGVGFTSVYQITDSPELLYGEEHWLLNELAPENERLRACGGDCGRPHGVEGTTFVLPWARDTSQLRSVLEVPPLSEHAIVNLEAALVQDAGRTLMFLQHVAAIEVVTRTESYSASRERTEDGLSIKDRHGEVRWLTLTSSFAGEAAAVISMAAGLIPPERPTGVTIAVPAGGAMAPGVLYATLPTETPSGLPGYVNASFYPKTDRKAVRFETGYDSDWNRAAIAAVGRGLAESAEVLADSLGITRFWDFLGAIYDIARRGEDNDLNHARAHMNTLRLAVPHLSVVETIDGGRATPRDALLPTESELYDAVPAFIALGLPVVAQHLHRRLHTNAVYAAYEIQQLTSRHVVEALTSGGFTEAFVPNDRALSRVDVIALLEALDRLPGKIANVEGIGSVALVPCRGGMVARAGDVLWPADETDGTLFEMLVDGLKIADVETIEHHCPGLRDVCTPLDISTAAGVLQDADRESLETLADELLDWLNRNLAPTTDDTTRALLARLPIFPTATRFEPLTNLSLPNDFRDPVGLATLVAAQFAVEYHRLLSGLGARPLDIVDYFRLHALPAINEEAIPITQATELLRLIAAHQDELTSLHDELSMAKVVPCLDGELHVPAEVHQQSRDIQTLAPELPIAATSGVAPAVLDWLGVGRAPSNEALAIAVERLALDQVESPVDVVEAILQTLQAREELPEEPPDFLTSQSWLPLRRHGRARPGAVLPTNARQLYGAQGDELGLPAEMQGRFFRQLTWLGMPSEPPVAMIVAHVKHCAENDLEMNQDVYRVLSNNAEATAVRSLRGTACVYVGGGRFVPPATAFWRPSPFGRWGATLPEAWLPYKPFFDVIGVKQDPGPPEVAAVLRSILDEYHTDRLDERAAEVVHGCWATLSELVEHPDATSTLAVLGHVRSTLDPRGLLARPDQLYFEDSRALHKRFPQLAHNVIPRVHGTWHALTQAGVRRVEELIKAKLIDVDAYEDTDLPERIADRTGALHRVFDDEDVLDHLREITVMRAPTLRVTFRAELFGHPFEVGPDTIDAIYLPDDGALYYSDGASARALARELARAIAPDEDPGPLAMRLEPILSAQSSDDAHAALDDYGIAKLNVLDHEVEWAPTAEVGDLSRQVDEDQDSDDAGSDTAPSASASASASEPDRTGTEDSENPSPDPDKERGGGGGTGSGESGGGNASGDRKRKETSTGAKGPRTGRQTRLRSYVVETDEDEGDIGTVGDEAPDLSPIDLAGVKRVLAYERACGREPNEKAHSNAGFDVESRDKRGGLVRRIEIKSTGGQWSVAGVMVSRRQHHQAVADGDLFWLYVVENAQDDNFRIYRIQNPASRIDYFGFDGGWKAVAEPDLDRDAVGTPTAGSTRGLLGRSPGHEG